MAEAEGFHTGAIVRFSTRRGDVVGVRIASSFIGPEQAALNLERETGGRSFEEIRNEGMTSGTVNSEGSSSRTKIQNMPVLLQLSLPGASLSEDVPRI